MQPVNPQFHWRLGWSRSECITVAQLRTGHSPLLASYLHRIGRQQSPLCPYCGGDNETAQHLLLCCPTHMQARTSTNYIDSTDPRRMMSFLETIGAVTRPPDREWERERKKVMNHTRSFSAASRLFCSRDRPTMSRREPTKTMAALSWEPVSTHNKSSRLTWTRVAIMEQSEQRTKP